MFVIINVAYFFVRRWVRRHQVDQGRDVGGVPVAVSRRRRCTTRNGFYEENGQPGPYFRASGPSGRARSPTAGPTSARRRAAECTAGHEWLSRGASSSRARSRGLGLATAALLHRRGWTVLAAMRSPEEGMQRLRGAHGGAR